MHRASGLQRYNCYFLPILMFNLDSFSAFSSFTAEMSKINFSVLRQAGQLKSLLSSQSRKRVAVELKAHK